MTLALVQAGPALALSGYASDQPAVNAQYPDAATAGSKGPGGGGVGSLRTLLSSRREPESSPSVAAHRRKVQREVEQQAALSSATGLGPSQSGSVVLLLGAIAVVSIGGVLRWRRRLTGV
jgi:hypothetical protein